MIENSKMLWLCKSCARRGSCRLGITEERLIAPGRTESALMCSLEYEAGPGVAHGGWTAAAMDDILGHLSIVEGRRAVTARLTVEFVKPVPLERQLTAIAWCESNEGGQRLHRAELRLATTGAVLARGCGIFVERDDSHFDRHRQWLAEQDASAIPRKT
jgi:acyl-coenzyme A thioesterase PaaI-like protein